jgi:hypothetical protein
MEKPAYIIAYRYDRITSRFAGAAIYATQQ